MAQEASRTDNFYWAMTFCCGSSTLLVFSMGLGCTEFPMRNIYT